MRKITAYWGRVSERNVNKGRVSEANVSNGSLWSLVIRNESLGVMRQKHKSECESMLCQ